MTVALAFFSAAWLRLAAKGMAEFAKNSGYARWVTGPILSENDRKALQEGDAARQDDILKKTIEIKQAFPDIKLNGHPQNRLAHNLSLTIPGVEAKAVIHLLKNKVSFSSGSACSTTKVEPSHVLKAIGLTDDETFQTIRLGLGRYTQNTHEIADILIHGLQQLKS